jgi:hypothetical protein
MPFIAFHQLLNLMGRCGKPMENYHLDQWFLKYNLIYIFNVNNMGIVHSKHILKPIRVFFFFPQF